LGYLKTGFSLTPKLLFIHLTTWSVEGEGRPALASADQEERYIRYINQI
jgi:hypothetical protein